MTSELGVGVSNKCKVKKRTGNVIGTMIPDKYVHRTLFVSTASGIRQLDFVDGQLDFISGQFPLSINNSFCIKCQKFDPSTAVLANCSAKIGKTYPAGSLSIGVGYAFGPFFTVVKGITEIGEVENKTYTGEGDFIVSRKNKHGAFLVHSSESNEGEKVYTYFEYANQPHLRVLLTKLSAALEKQNGSFLTVQPIWERTEGPTHTQQIQCEIEKFNSFRGIIQSYRSMQLENMLFPPQYEKESEMFERITEDDLYRAGLKYRIVFSEAYNTYETAEYFTYTECAFFDWIFIIPLLVVVLIVALLYIIELAKLRRGLQINVPYSSKTWFDEMIRRLQRLESRNLFRRVSAASLRKMAKWNTVDEAVLLDAGTPNMKIGYCRNGVMVNMDRALQQVEQVNNSDLTFDSMVRSRSTSTASGSQAESYERRDEMGSRD